MDFQTAVKTCFQKYVDFEGRAQRSEYWWFVLFNWLVSLVISIFLQSEAISSIYSLAVLIPSLAVGARRLHDTDRTGWWQLLAFIPILGWIILIIWYATPGKAEDNQYGSNPLGTHHGYHQSAAQQTAAQPSRDKAAEDTAVEEEQKKITEVEKKRIEPPRFGRDASKD